MKLQTLMNRRAFALSALTLAGMLSANSAFAVAETAPERKLNKN